ncbi:hypothetical protein DY000_02060460 [Brassica cretica]|uniref:DUF1985 domain-containing protein n=1 Tax=Brassica cretica TaxID=69181 RepID=A0ABQ7AQ72_BRACR|nr:hypothetical protein DY000_02060460 [Brassica cretica]
MNYQFPKRILEEGAETNIDKINNTCRRTILGTLKVVLRDEYQEVLKDPVFGPILAIVENKLIYSGKVIHSFICKQLKVSKVHELWFLFVKRPLRFSMKEFYAVTGLKFKEEPDVDFNNWKSDKGFWSTVLKENKKINLLVIRDELLKVCNEWTYVHRVRLVYLCIIHGFVIAKDLRVFIPHEFIRLVMDFEKMRMYPWGLRAYDELLASIFKAREDVHLKNSYLIFELLLNSIFFGMDYQFPKRILEEGAETKMDKINNTCRRTILETLKVVLKDEYQEVLKDPVFGPILAIIENKLIYSGKIIHSFICKQLKVSKLHELWFLFAKRPLRFSMQEFYVMTGLKFKEEPDIDFNNWKSDKGFWSTVLKENRKMNLLIIRDELLKDLRVFIPHEFIRLVMVFEKMRMYPWGLRAYDELLASIFKAREDVHLKNIYVLDGFSYAFQIWIMEAIPDIGSMVGKNIKNNLTKVRCRNWKGSGKVSYQDITSLESHFDKGELFPFISSTGSSEAIDNAEFFREDEKNDERVCCIVALISAKQDWKQFTWEVETLPPNMELTDA